MSLSRSWTLTWIVWAVGGLGTALVLIVAIELGWNATGHVWWWWALPGAVGGATIEIAAIARRGRGDTLSEHVWAMDTSWRSLTVTTVLWLAWFLATADPWPSAGIFFLGWTAYHFALEGPDAAVRR